MERTDCIALCTCDLHGLVWLLDASGCFWMLDGWVAHGVVDDCYVVLVE